MRFDRDAIVAAVDLRALCDELLGPHAGTERHPTWPCPNPQHAQTGRTPPVSLFTTSRGEQRWHCHGCGDGGSAIDLVIACRHTDTRGALEQLANHHPTPVASTRPTPPVPEARPDPDGLCRYVDACARRLWRPAGADVLAWLRHDRGIDDATLRRNAIGADPGPHLQSRPAGMPRAAGALLPVIEHCTPVYAQLRLLHPRGDQPRYLNPAAQLATNPRVARIRPDTRTGDAIVITEGIIDALTAAAGGHRAAAVLGAGYPNAAVADHLARLPGRLVLAFDPDDAGQRSAEQLTTLLIERLRPPHLLPAGDGDLNERRLHSADWPADLDALIAAAPPTIRSPDIARDWSLGRA